MIPGLIPALIAGALTLASIIIVLVNVIQAFIEWRENKK